MESNPHVEGADPSAPEDAGRPHAEASANQPAAGPADRPVPGHTNEPGGAETHEPGGRAVASLPDSDSAPDSLAEPAPAAQQTRAEVELPPHVSTILGPVPAQVSVAKTRDLNDAVHQILIVGLFVSTVLLVFGLVLDAVRARPLPTATLPPGQALAAAIALRPSGFLSLGLITLMATPIVRVIGSVIVFIWERDHLYTAVTLLVLVVLVISILVGQG